MFVSNKNGTLHRSIIKISAKITVKITYSEFWFVQNLTYKFRFRINELIY